MSLSQDPAYSALKNYFVCGFKDITHESYSGMSGRHTTFGNAVNTTNGAGPRNLQLFMLSSDGTVLHCLPSYWYSRDLVYEMIFAAQLDEVYKDRSLGAREKAERFRAMQLAHAAQHPKQMSNRSHMQGFDQQYEAKNRLDETDTIKDVNAVKAALKTDSHIPGYAFKTTDVLLHERMASRPFVHYSRFDVAKFSDYGKPIYDKNEDQRDVRTGETIVHNGHKDLIGNPIVLAKQKYGKKWRNYVDDPSSAKGWGENTAGAGQGAWSDSGQQSRAKSWGEYQGQGSLWGQQNDSHKNNKKKGR